MPVDTSSHEFLLLLRQFEKGNAVLFAGAGFSIGARNSQHTDPPDAKALARLLATECGWEYQDEDLPVVFAQAERHLGTKALRSFLATLYQDCTPAHWHYLVSQLHWYRIYTTNIDDVIEQSYAGKPAQVMDMLVCPTDYQEPDPWYQRVQCVHLHGSVLADKPLTFTLGDFGQRTAVSDPWYQQFVEDMQSKSIVFIGTRLAEPPYYHYLSLRAKRPAGSAEIRAKCFIVAPQNSPILRREFEAQGYAVIDATAEEFLTALAERVTNLVSGPLDIVRKKYPHMAPAIAAGVWEHQSELLKQFDFVSVFETVDGQVPRSTFLLGAEPTWPDIVYGIDAPRGVTRTLEQTLSNVDPGVQLFVVIGPAGSGKSTALRRAAYELTRSGHAVYFSKAQYRIDLKPLIGFAHTLGSQRAYVFIDDAVLHLETLNALLSEIPTVNLVFVVADQSHLLNPRIAALKLAPKQIVSMPHLDQADCEAILDALHRHGLLGVLTGRSREDQVREFLIRSRKQLLVAMKEATSGRGFDIIIAQEYGTLASESARLAYSVACLAYMHGAAVRRRHVTSCLDGSDYEKALVLRTQLTDVLLPWRESEEFLSPRHRVIARQVVADTAPRGMIRDAIVRFVIAIAADITPQNITKRTPEYLAFRGILNFDNMHMMFGDAYDLIDGVYTELKPYCDGNFLYWLQRGRLEVHFDRFDTAQNFLDASLSIRESVQTWHYLGVLQLKKAFAEPSEGVASDLAARGEDILRRQIQDRGRNDPYPYAALVEHKLRYLDRHRGPRHNAHVKELYELARQGVERHPFDNAVKAAHQQAYRQYLMLSVDTPPDGNLA